MAKQILAIVGSYRENGIIDQAVDQLFAAAAARGARCRTVYLRNKRIEFCRNCRSCTQQPGTGRGACVLNDEMGEILKQIDEADVLVLASPMNFGQVTAITKRFIERLIPYGYWPWGKVVPAMRNKARRKKAVIMTSSAMPALMGRLLTGIVRTLKDAVHTMGAEVAGVVYMGMVPPQPSPVLSPRFRLKAERMAARLLS